MTRELEEKRNIAIAAATVIDNPVIVVDTTSREELEDVCQVVLWNDDHNEAGFVVRCLERVFGHAETLATKIMFEAHNNGKAIAEIEGRESARLHCQQMQSCGLTCTVEPVIGKK